MENKPIILTWFQNLRDEIKLSQLIVEGLNWTVQTQISNVTSRFEIYQNDNSTCIKWHPKLWSFFLVFLMSQVGVCYDLKWII